METKSSILNIALETGILEYLDVDFCFLQLKIAKKKGKFIKKKG